MLITIPGRRQVGILLGLTAGFMGGWLAPGVDTLDEAVVPFTLLVGGWALTLLSMHRKV
jgi:hypothetical protein